MGLLVLAGLVVALAWPTLHDPGRPAEGNGLAAVVAPLPTWALDPALIARGAVVAKLGHCAGCHTAPGGPPLAGPRAIDTPFGTVHAGNLTPDPATGLGAWSADDFRRALLQGRGRDGRPLVPAFPYPSYTRMDPQDVDALYAWLRAQPPVVRARPPHALRTWAGHPWSLRAWQALFFRPGPLALPADASPEWRRGAELVHGLGHCGACHAPHPMPGQARAAADGVGEDLGGAVMPGARWYAPPLNPVAGEDPARWRDDLLALLRDGQHARGSANGPMAEVVAGSTQHWPEADLQAMATYLATLPPRPAPARPQPAPPEVLAQGRELYQQRCADCHGEGGQGAAGRVPALAGNPTVLHREPHTLIQAVRHGGFAPVTAAHPRPHGMPPTELDATSMAALLTALRQSWGNAAAPVTPMQVLRTP